MRERDFVREMEEERRLRRAAVRKHTGQVPEPPPAGLASQQPPSGPSSQQPPSGPASQQPPAGLASPEPDEDEEDAAAKRMEQRTLWVDMQVRRAMERGEFDNLPGAGKPIKGLGSTHDPDWWVKGLIERERITGVLPPALALRKEDAELEDSLDRETTEQGVRRIVADFNRRVVEARRQLRGGPPVVTPTRDEDAEVAAWRGRVAERRERQRRRLEEQAGASDVRPKRRRWWHRAR
jgi:Domain of unknown function (DUF1992)